MVVENAFGRLKGRWRCLLKRMDFKLINVPLVVAACVTLHNYCEVSSDACLQEWEVPSEPSHHSATTSSSLLDGSSIRDAIMEHLSR